MLAPLVAAALLLPSLSTAAAAEPSRDPPSSSTVVFAGVRVAALSPTLIRIEIRGPLGFCNASTFLAVNRSAFGTGVPLKTESSNTSHAILATEEYRISLSVGTDANGSALVGASIAAVGSSGAGAALWSTADLTSTSARLRWPDPMQGQAYAIKDFPRFYTPPWGPTPMIPRCSRRMAMISAGTSMATCTSSWGCSRWMDGLLVAGSFLPSLGQPPCSPTGRSGCGLRTGTRVRILDVQAIRCVLANVIWHPRLRKHFELIAIVFIADNESFAKAEIQNWTTHKLPLDIWGLDMNWRNTPHGHASTVSTAQAVEDEKHYNSPNIELIPDLANPSWFDWIKAQGLRTHLLRSICLQGLNHTSNP